MAVIITVCYDFLASASCAPLSVSILPVGTGMYACTCDYCRSVHIPPSSVYSQGILTVTPRGGKALPDKIYNKQSAARMGLSLPRGPDPRSRTSMGPPPL